MNDPQVIGRLPPDVQLAFDAGDMQIKHAKEAKFYNSGRTEVVLTFRQYLAMREYIYGKAKNSW